jgi:hypothetical protein
VYFLPFRAAVGKKDKTFTNYLYKLLKIKKWGDVVAQSRDVVAQRVKSLGDTRLKVQQS